MLLTRAEAYIFGGIADRALLPLRRAIEIDPANHGAHWALMLAAWRALEHEQCIEASDTYLRRFGPDRGVHMTMASSHQLLGNLDLAEHHFERSLELSNDSPQAIMLVYAGSLFQEIGRQERAVERLIWIDLSNNLGVPANGPSLW
jgi:tetratricopeptide (TPR) repeat protein